MTNKEYEVGNPFLAADSLLPARLLDELNAQMVGVLRIKQDGHIFWNGREVESDAEFRAAMMDLVTSMIKGVCHD